MSQTWRVSPLGRVGAPIAAVFLAGVNYLSGGPVSGASWLIFLLLLCFLLAWWPTVTLTTDEVVVRNPWGVSRLPVAEIDSVGGGYFGLALRTRSGRSVTAWAVQKSNGAKWSGRRTRADEVATAILTAAKAARLTRT